MKLSSLLLGATLAVNAALLVVFLAGRALNAPDAAESAATAAAAATASNASATAASKAAPVDPETWTRLQADDAPGLLAKLRAQGFPPDVIRAIVAEQVRVQFAPRRTALELKANESPFWMAARPRDPKIAAELQQIMKEQNQAVKDLLGPDPMANEQFTANLRRHFPNWPEEKFAELQRLQEDFNERRSEVFSLASGGTILPADREKLTLLEKEQRAAIARTLTPEEFEEYELRTSNTATSLRYRLSAFDATEQEFRTLFKLQQGFDERFGLMYTAPSQDEMRARNEAQQQLNEQIKTALGPERAAAYERANDYSYRQSTMLVARLGLPPETADQLYAIQKEMQPQAGSPLMTARNATERMQQAAAMVAQAEQRVAALLGPTGLEAYKQNGGTWLMSLSRMAAPPQPPPTRSP